MMTRREALKIGYSSSQFLSASGSLALAIYTQSQSLVLTVPLALISGVISYTRTYEFLCREMNDSVEGEEIETYPIVLTQPQANSLIWTYTLSAYVQELGLNYFLLDSFLAWKNEFSSHTLTLSAMSPAMLALVFIYTSCINLPFMLSSDVFETSQEIGKKAGIKERPVMDVLLTPFMYFRTLANLSIWLGCLARGFELSLNLVMSIPPEYFLQLQTLGGVLLFSGCATFALLTSVIIVTQAVQSLYFEGRYSLENLSIEEHVDTSHKDLRYYLLKFSQPFLALHGFLDGLEDSRTIFILALSLGMGPASLALAALEGCVVSFGAMSTYVFRSNMNTTEELAKYEP